jgi:hypothetical protein
LKGEQGGHGGSHDFGLSGGRGERRFHRGHCRFRHGEEGGGADARSALRMRSLSEHIGAPADFARHFAPARRERIGARNGADRHAEFIGQVAQRRQSRAGRHRPGPDGIA